MKLEMVAIAIGIRRVDKAVVAGLVVLLRNQFLAIKHILTLIVIAQVHGDDIRIAPRIAIDQIIADARRRVVARAFGGQEFGRLGIFDVVVIDRIGAGGIVGQVHLAQRL